MSRPTSTSTSTPTPAPTPPSRLLPPALVLAGADLRRLSRDRIGLFFTFALPLLIIIVLGAAIPSGELTVGIVDLDQSATSDVLVRAIETQPGLKVRHYGTLVGLQTAVRRDEIDGGVVLDQGLEASVDAGRQATVGMLTSPSSANVVVLNTQISSAIAPHSAIVLAARTALSSGLSTQPTYGAAVAAATRLSGQPPLLAVSVTTTKRTGVKAIRVGEYATIGELVLFVFLIALVGSSDLIEARRLGVTRRVMVSDASVTDIVVGHSLGRLAIAGLQVALIVTFTGLVFGVRWGNPLGVAAVIGAFAMASVGAGMLIGSIVRTPEQATSIGPILGIAFGMLGGCMWPLEITPPAVRALGHVTPHAWALDALVRLMSADADTAAILRTVGTLLGFVVVLLSLGAWRLRRTITR
jgi:ABC-2 type transport system permease protein